MVLDLSWLISTQHMDHLRRLMKLKTSTVLQKSFYIATLESVLRSIVAWFGNCSSQSVRQCAQRITRSALPSLSGIYTRRRRFRANRIIKDVHQPNHKLFQWLPSGKRLHSLKARTEKLRRSFSLQAIRTLNMYVNLSCTFVYFSF